MSPGSFFEDVLDHNAETSHRLPQLGGKCVSLHGHSWRFQVSIGIPELENGIGVEFGLFKTGFRKWVDAYLDHGTMLGAADNLVGLLGQDPQNKVFRFGAGIHAVGEESLAADLDWPTVENVATLIERVATKVLITCDRAPGTWIYQVKVKETAVNGVVKTIPAPQAPMITALQREWASA